jgi:cytochrome c oxidase subunit 2
MIQQPPRKLCVLATLLLLPATTACTAETPQTAFNPHSDYAILGLDLFQAIIVLGVIVGVLVEAVLIWAALRYRRRTTDQLPPQVHGNTLVEIAWTTGPVLVVGFILYLTIPVIFQTQAPAPTGAMDVEVVGHQFWWEFRYPDANVDTANELHLPVGRTVNLILHSNDVIHSFWIPALGGKRDAIPGHTNFIWLTPNSTGNFPGQCYQLCGYSHANMRDRAIIQTQPDFDAWLAAQEEPPAQPDQTDALAAEGARLFQTTTCPSCHTISGTPAQGKIGPNLTHFASRGTFAGSILETNADNIRLWLKDPPAVKPGSLMPNYHLTEHQLDVLVAYLEALQ